MKPEEKKGSDAPANTSVNAAMTARQERQQREAQALRANLMRRKQQRNRPGAGRTAGTDSTSGEGR